MVMMAMRITRVMLRCLITFSRYRVTGAGFVPLKVAPGQLPSSELEDGKAAADLPDKRVADLGMSGDGFDGAGDRIGPE
jgi:hypothetical protein